MARKKGRKNDDEGAARGGSSSRALIFGAVALIAGLSATVVLWKMVENYEKRIAMAQAPDPTVTAIVAQRDLYQGITITEDDILALPIEPEYLPGGNEDLVFLAPEHIIGRTPKERILANEWIREDRLADFQRGAGLNALIPRGMRAISLQVAEGAALSGFLNPGDYVDVVVTIYPEEGDKLAETRTLVQAVYVLAVNDRKDNEQEEEEDEDGKKKKKKKKKKSTKRKKPTTTLAVTPEQAEEIAYAAAQGEITLSLRNQADLEFEEAIAGGSDIWDVLGEERPEDKPEPPPVKSTPKPPPVAAPEPEEETGPTLQIIKGTNSTTKELGG